MDWNLSWSINFIIAYIKDDHFLEWKLGNETNALRRLKCIPLYAYSLSSTHTSASSMLKRSSSEFCGTKTNVINSANHNKGKQKYKPIRTQSKCMHVYQSPSAGKPVVLVRPLWENSATTFSQSKSLVRQNQSKRVIPTTISWRVL